MCKLGVESLRYVIAPRIPALFLHASRENYKYFKNFLKPRSKIKVKLSFKL